MILVRGSNTRKGDIMNYNKISQKPRPQPERMQPPEVTDATPAIISNKIATVVSISRLNVRKEPNITSPVITTVNPGDKLNVIELDNEWAHISMDDTGKAYVMAGYIKFDEE
jgi:N-acetylmuramoyl-L-alanine amidase